MIPTRTGKTIRALLVADDLRIYHMLRELLSIHDPDVQVLGRATSVDEAYVRCSILKPDLVLLDTDLPGENPFQLAGRYEKVPFGIIFLASNNQYIVQALRYAALEYVLKPVNGPDLHEALLRFRAGHRPLDAQLRMPLSARSHEVIALPVETGFELVSLREIIYCESCDNHTFYHLAGGRKLTVHRSLKESGQLLYYAGFLRIHPSFLVNTLHVASFRRSLIGGVVMSDGSALPVSPRQESEEPYFLAQA